MKDKQTYSHINNVNPPSSGGIAPVRELFARALRRREYEHDVRLVFSDWDGKEAGLTL